MTPKDENHVLEELEQLACTCNSSIGVKLRRILSCRLEEGHEGAGEDRQGNGAVNLKGAEDCRKFFKKKRRSMQQEIT